MNQPSSANVLLTVSAKNDKLELKSLSINTVLCPSFVLSPGMPKHEAPYEAP